MFQDCIKNTGGDIAPCQSYMDMMMKCRQRKCLAYICTYSRWSEVVFDHLMMVRLSRASPACIMCTDFYPLDVFRVSWRLR